MEFARPTVAASPSVSGLSSASSPLAIMSLLLRPSLFRLSDTIHLAVAHALHFTSSLWEETTATRLWEPCMLFNARSGTNVIGRRMESLL
ncbi:hypothetical protein BD310DRAFT_112623 [Dichomitus squalens]|uniref:Uncharacterized protein n=1 Tax=Dichomitus squalens TaxID=114155 RepID=A0A4Q9PIR8_9APHY|nr:hypothetical protein BD310DRAFT_112623 [Dichomitus squalens]